MIPLRYVFPVDENHINSVSFVNLNDTVSTPIGPMIITPTLYYTDVFYGKPVSVVKSNLESVIEGYRTRLKVSLASKTATIINLVLDDVSTARAEDILNMLIAVYLQIH